MSEEFLNLEAEGSTVEERERETVKLVCSIPQCRLQHVLYTNDRLVWATPRADNRVVRAVSTETCIVTRIDVAKSRSPPSRKGLLLQLREYRESMLPFTPRFMQLVVRRLR